MTITANEPILASWKVSEVLKRYPGLVESFVRLSPAFSLLRNPVARRIQAPLVTVARVAEMAGLDPAQVVRQLNEDAGLSAAAVAEAPSEQPARETPAFDPASLTVVEDLDVRDFHARGEEPFGVIMRAARAVPAGGALRLRNTFDPLPLHDVLGKQGFSTHARQLDDRDWEITFVRNRAPVPSAEPAREEAGQRPPIPAPTHTVDVSDLVPPEPMVKILETMLELPAGETLLVEHARRPVHLYPRLDDLGYVHETRELGPNRVQLLIHKPIGTGSPA